MRERRVIGRTVREGTVRGRTVREEAVKETGWGKRRFRDEEVTSIGC